MTVFRDMYGNRPSGSVSDCGGESRTKQSFREECDINTIMRRYERSGVLPQGVGNGRYGDFSSVGSFQQAQNVLLTAEQQFAALPSRVRDRFKNSPVEFLKFVNNKANFEEARSLGILKDEVKPVVTPPVEGTPAA